MRLLEIARVRPLIDPQGIRRIRIERNNGTIDIGCNTITIIYRYPGRIVYGGTRLEIRPELRIVRCVGSCLLCEN